VLVRCGLLVESMDDKVEYKDRYNGDFDGDVQDNGGLGGRVEVKLSLSLAREMMDSKQVNERGRERVCVCVHVMEKGIKTDSWRKTKLMETNILPIRESHREQRCTQG